MTTIDSSYVQSMATQLANYEVQALSTRASRNEAKYQSELSAIAKLESALKTFTTALGKLSGTGSSTLLTNSVTLSNDSYAKASVDASAVEGSYDFFVEQLATSHQLSIQGLSDGDIDNSGNLVIDQAGSSFSIDLSAIDTDGDGSNSLAELAAAINNSSDNSGVSATLVRSNGEVSLVLASKESGAANAISLSTTGTSGGVFDTAISGNTTLSVAQDAQVRLGGETGMLLTSSSNTFDDLIDGVSVTFTQAHKSGESPLNISVGRDESATKEKVQSFVDAINELFSTFDSLTKAGSDSASRGVLAGDASVRSIESMLNNTIRGQFGGISLMDFGIIADRNGKIEIDSARFEKALTANPTGLDSLFTADSALLDTIDTKLDAFTNSNNSIIKSRKDSLNANLARIDDQFVKIQEQYDNYYTRYLKQYTNMMQIMNSMEQTYGLF